MLAGVFCLVLSRIYGLFSHGVHSVFMDTFFLLPFLNGIFLLIWFFCFPGFRGRKRHFQFFSSFFSLMFFNRIAVSFFCTGMFLSGVLEIAGTASALPAFLFFAGFLIFLAGIAVFFHTPAARHPDLPHQFAHAQG